MKYLSSKALKNLSRITGIFVFLSCVLCVFSSFSYAQIEEKSYISLSKDTSRIFIGPKTYITRDQSKSLNYKSIITRYQNNLRGDLQNKDIINLGLTRLPVWMIFSAVNYSGQEDWVLDFGHIFQGRLGMADKLLVYNATTRETFFRATNPEKEGLAHSKIYGSAIPVNIAKDKENIFIVYYEAEGALPNLIVPQLVTQDYFIKNILSFKYLSLVVPVSFIILIIFFLFFSYLNKNVTYAIFSIFYFLNYYIFSSIENNFISSFSFSAEVFTSLFFANIFIGIVLAATFFDIRSDDKKDVVLLKVLAGLSLFFCLVNAVYFNSYSILNYFLLFFPPVLGALALAMFALWQNYKKKYAAIHFAVAWLSYVLSLLIMLLVVTGILSPYNFLVNTYWIFLIPQALFFVLACFQKEHLLAIDRSEEETKKAREKNNQERLKQSKKSADQTRILRVLERERELMADLRERERQRSEEMRKAKDMADQANRAKSAYLAVISHEIRTPMTGIMGMVKLLMDSRLNKVQTDYALAIQKSGDSMMTLLNDILDFEKIETGSMKLEYIDFDLHKLVTGVVTLMSGQAQEKNISVSADISSDVPVSVKGDPTRLRQVLLNLTSNAIKFTEKGGVVLKLRSKHLPDFVVKDSKNKDGVYEIRWSIEDTGIGIPIEAQETLFDTFTQAEDSTARKYGGSGLGLAICKKLIEAMGSTIELESEPGRGSTFSYTLKMERGLEISDNSDSRAHESLSDMSDSGIPPQKILVIEDNEMNRRVLLGLLEKIGHHPTIAKAGEEAIEKIIQDDFDMIFTDIQLTGMSGIDTTRTIRYMPDENKASTPIVAITGNTQEHHIKEYYEANINGVLAKPIDPYKLAKIVEQVYEGVLENPVKLPDSQDSQFISEKPSNHETSKLDQYIQNQSESDMSQNPVETLSENESTGHEAQTNDFDLTELSKDMTIEDLDEDSFSQAIEQMEDAKNAELQESASASTEDSDALDYNLLKELSSSLGKDQMVALIEDYLTYAKDISDKLIVAAQEKNSNEVKDRAHELKGMAANFGIAIVQQHAISIERAVYDEKLELMIDLVSQLTAVNDKAQNVVQQWLDGL